MIDCFFTSDAYKWAWVGIAVFSLIGFLESHLKKNGKGFMNRSWWTLLAVILVVFLVKSFRLMYDCANGFPP